jgi:hypothetical protein
MLAILHLSGIITSTKNGFTLVLRNGSKALMEKDTIEIFYGMELSQTTEKLLVTDNKETTRSLTKLQFKVQEF